MSVFSDMPRSSWLAENDLAFAVKDGFPVSPGHSLIITKREVATWFDATPEEQRAVMELAGQVKTLLDDSLVPRPDGWNIGVNAGVAGGQTVAHLHVHVIPRWHGDVPDPTGGVRHVIPGRGNYRKTGTGSDDLSIGHPDDPFLARLQPELDGAREVDILAAFVQVSGVDLIGPPLLRTLASGAKVRVLAGDYLAISDPRALASLAAMADLPEADWPETADFEARVVELARLPGHPVSFHPKAWRIVREDRTVVWVGSSNLSRAALASGVEWNLRATSGERPQACEQVRHAFQALWDQARAIDAEWIAAYAQRRVQTTVAASPEEAADVEAEPESLEPRPWQAEALMRLDALRRSGHRRALAAVATGMGKTVLAALDAARMLQGNSQGKVIVIAHRAEILAQAGTTLREILGIGRTLSWCMGGNDHLDGDVVLASVQKLCRPAMLRRLAQEHFAYAVIDEVHHAEAASWRRVMDHLQADFILGLTATPERADGRDVAAMFDDVLACEAGIGTGIEEGALVPFSYHGLADDVDYQQIPWRSGRFLSQDLEDAVIDSPRMDRLWEAWQGLPGTRTLVFCCGQRHAVFTRNWLRERGVSAACVHAGSGSDDRDQALRDLRNGTLQALCSVDMFNEGVDLPDVDRVVMLRPTESPVLLAQQLGRGLRAADGKTRLTVIDFVGNHRVFIWRLKTLLALAGGLGDVAELRRMLAGETLVLSRDCLIDVTLEAKDLLRHLLPQAGGAVLEAYRDLREQLGRRPTPLELFHRGCLPQTLRSQHDHWFAFVAAQEDLDERERAIVAQHAEWLRFVETTNLNKCYKMAALRVLLDSGHLVEGEPLSRHAERARAYLLGHPVLRKDLTPSKEMPDHSAATAQAWATWWGKWPISHLKPWIFSTDGVLRNRLNVSDADLDILLAMTAELVDWRLATYARRLDRPKEGSFEAKISHSGGKPILFLPTVDQEPLRPIGPTEVCLPDGTTWVFRMVKVACNVAMPHGEQDNRLPDLLRGWFGERAGAPGTTATVRFTRNEDGWIIEPVGAHLVEPSVAPVAGISGLPPGVIQDRPDDTAAWLPVYELAAAGGDFSGSQAESILGWTPRPATLHGGNDAFVIQVRGHSMEPTIPDGAWCLFRPVRPGSRENKIVLVQYHGLGDPDNGGSFTVKRYASRKTIGEDGWQHQAITLLPDNDAFAAINIDPHEAGDLRIIGEFVETLAEDGTV